MASQVPQAQARAAAQVIRAVDPRAATARLAAIRAELNDEFVERPKEIDALLIALLSGQNIVLLGHPGEGKSALLEALTARIADAHLFSTLMMKTTLPEELFGPVDIMGMKRGVYQRLTDGYMADQGASGTVIYLDEVFKAGSAILNALLGIVNEHRFKNGTQTLTIPLLLFAGASNEYPTGEELNALWDRMTIRVWVSTVSDAGHRQFMARERDRRQARAQALMHGGAAPGIGQGGTKISVAEVRALQALALAVEIPDAVLETWYRLRDLLSVRQGAPSTRRSGWLEGLMCANAVLNGRTVATEDDLIPLQYALWNDKAEIRDFAMTVMGVAAPVLKEAQERYDAMLSEVDKCLVLYGQGASETEKMTQLQKARQSAQTTAAKLQALYHQLKGAGRDTAPVEALLSDANEKYQKVFRITTEAMNPDMFGV
jgi:MoxR-like ATPase